MWFSEHPTERATHTAYSHSWYWAVRGEGCGQIDTLDSDTMVGDTDTVQDMFNSMDTQEKLEMLYNNSLEEEKNLAILINNTDEFFLIVIAIIIFFMQCGFAFLEAGSVR